jgi:hypothetical protein
MTADSSGRGCRARRWSYQNLYQPKSLESDTTAGDSPVSDGEGSPVWYLSKTGHVEAGPNLRGPSRKAKYSLATDSEPSRASDRWEEPLQGEDSEPETTCLQALRALRRKPG